MMIEEVIYDGNQNRARTVCKAVIEQIIKLVAHDGIKPQQRFVQNDDSAIACKA